MTTMLANGSVLSEAMLDGFRAKAGTYDRENSFFKEDFEVLQRAGYLKMAVPAELGGLGMSVADVCREQRRLAAYGNIHVGRRGRRWAPRA